MKKTTLLLCFCLTLCWSCSNSIELAIDNPLNKERSIILDDQVIVLPPQETTTIEVARGDHSIKLENDSIISYQFDKDKYLINPTLTDYVIEKIYFSQSGSPTLEAIFNETNRKTIVFLGYEIQGNYEVFNDLIMAEDWDFEQRESVPDVISVEDKKFSSSQTIRKLYAADEFLQHMKDKK